MRYLERLLAKLWKPVPPAPEPPAIKVHAYAVMPLYGGSGGSPFVDIGIITAVFSPYAYLHYWVDENFNYHEKQLDTPTPLPLVFVQLPNVEVELRGPNNFEVHRY